LIENNPDGPAKYDSELMRSRYQIFFDTLDLDNDGTLDIFETLTLLQNGFTVLSINKKDIIIFMNIIDRNSDGLLTYDEFYRTMETQNTPLVSYMRDLILGVVQWKDIQLITPDGSSNDTYVQIQYENLNTNYGGFC
jgi:hypothetical protein